MKTQKVKARRLTQEEVAALDTKTEILVHANMSGLPRFDCYAPAHLTKPGSDFEGGFVEVETVFGEKLNESAEPDPIEFGIYIADKEGSEVEVLQSAGLYMNLALFVPDGDVEELYKLYALIRKEHGEGTVQIWKQEVALVPDAQFDIYQVATRGKKGADGPKRERVTTGVYAQRVPFIPVKDTYRKDVELHTPIVDDTPTI